MDEFSTFLAQDPAIMFLKAIALFVTNSSISISLESIADTSCELSEGKECHLLSGLFDMLNVK